MSNISGPCEFATCKKIARVVVQKDFGPVRLCVSHANSERRSNAGNLGALDKAESERDAAYAKGCRESVAAFTSAVVAAVGGEVEGQPTSSLNYLQRCRALVRDVADLEAKLAIARMAADNARAETERADAWAVASEKALVASVASARAVAMEEAITEWADCLQTGGDIRDRLRALAPLPSGLVVVTREAIDATRAALEQFDSAVWDRLYGKGPLAVEYAQGTSDKIRAALALLEAVK